MEALKSIKDFINSPFSSITEWLSDKFINSITFLIDSSHWVLLGVGMVALFLYIAGYKDSRKYTTLSAVTYLLLKILKLALI